MMVYEDRSSCALLVERDGRREHVIFDDIGCMIVFRHDHADDTKVAETWLHDHATRRWIAADDAHILAADPDRLMTPMGYGLAAFQTASAAEEAKSKYGGTVSSFSRAAEYHPARHRSSAPSDP